MATLLILFVASYISPIISQAAFDQLDILPNNIRLSFGRNGQPDGFRRPLMPPTNDQFRQELGPMRVEMGQVPGSDKIFVNVLIDHCQPLPDYYRDPTVETCFPGNYTIVGMSGENGELCSHLERAIYAGKTVARLPFDHYCCEPAIPLPMSVGTSDIAGTNPFVTDNEEPDFNVIDVSLSWTIERSPGCFLSAEGQGPRSLLSAHGVLHYEWTHLDGGINLSSSSIQASHNFGETCSIFAFYDTVTMSGSTIVNHGGTLSSFGLTMNESSIEIARNAVLELHTGFSMAQSQINVQPNALLSGLQSEIKDSLLHMGDSATMTVSGESAISGTGFVFSAMDKSEVMLFGGSKLSMGKMTTITVGPHSQFHLNGGSLTLAKGAVLGMGQRAAFTLGSEYTMCVLNGELFLDDFSQTTLHPSHSIPSVIFCY